MLTEGGERDGVGGDGGEAGSGETVARRGRGRRQRDGGEGEKRVVNWERKISGGNQAARGVR